MLKLHNLIKLNKFLTVNFPKISFYENKIENEGLKFIKLNRSFWEIACKDKYWTDIYHKIHDESLLNDVLEIIKTINKIDIILSVSPLGPPQLINCDRQKEDLLSKKITETIPEYYLPHFACNWKIYSLNKTIFSFYEKIKKEKVIIVGMEHLKEIKETLKFENLIHYKLNFSSSKLVKRQEILNDLLKIENKEKSIFLFQAGEIFSSWLIYNMNKNLTHKSSLIDMGRSLDMFCPNREFCEEDKQLNILEDFKKQDWLTIKFNENDWN